METKQDPNRGEKEKQSVPCHCENGFFHEEMTEEERKSRFSLATKATFLVFCVLLISGSLTGLSLVILDGLKLIPDYVAATVWLPIVALIVSAAIGTCLSAVASRHFLQPIKKLSEEMRVVAKGDFSPRMEVGSHSGEIAVLIQSFNTMTEELGGIEMFRNDFINTFSHEFKTPIVSVRGFAKQLQNETLTPEERAEYTRIIVAESERLIGMASNVLLLSRFEHQQIVSDRAPFSLDEQLRGAVLLLENQWEKKNLEISCELPDITYVGNAEMMNQIWVNLLTNAVKFTPPDGSITVSAAQTEEGVAVSVTDTGIGMDEETRKRVFEKFFQGDASHTGIGNGLGLAIVHRIVQLCGGSVAVESEPGKGSTFTVTLPHSVPPQ